jgi:Helix-turn-helix domain
MIDRGELPAVRVGSRRVRVRRTDLDQFLEAGSTETRPEPEAPEVDERTVTAWTTFGTAMAEATATLERTDREAFVVALERLAEATLALTDFLRADA